MRHQAQGFPAKEVALRLLVEGGVKSRWIMISNDHKEQQMISCFPWAFNANKVDPRIFITDAGTETMILLGYISFFNSSRI